MPRQKNDGRGRLGGRAAGTPNKEKPLKTFLREHSLEYFTPNVEDKKTGTFVSQFDLDISELEPRERVDAELKLLKFHTPQMQSTSVDMSISDDKKSLAQHLAELAACDTSN